MGENIVFVLGAGASKEVGLPTGFELKNIISHLLNIKFEYGIKQISGDLLIKNALEIHVRITKEPGTNLNTYLHQAWHITEALPQAISIDNFIDAQRGNDKIALCGKLAIVRSILQSERESRLYFEPPNSPKMNMSGLENSWFIPLFQLLSENCDKNDIKERLRSITFIIFNYDRCIEHFLYNGLQNYYRLTEEETKELIKSIKIYHPYGVVGTLPWLKSYRTIQFGGEPNPTQLLELSKMIKTYTEGTDPESSEISEIREHMKNANKVVFLGFAFHELNMSLIKPAKIDGTRIYKIKCFATTNGISFSDAQIVKDQLRWLFDDQVEILTDFKTCNKFFNDYWRSLSFLRNNNGK